MERKIAVIKCKRQTKSLPIGNHKFTIIELLVVIAIIAILASILLPSLESARKRTKTILCAGNLRQISMASVQYTNDYNGIMKGWKDDWQAKLIPYAGCRGILWICPSSPEINTGGAAMLDAIQDPDSTVFTNSGAMYWLQTIGINAMAFTDNLKSWKIKNPSTLIYNADATGAFPQWYNPRNANGGRYMINKVYPDHGSSLYPRHQKGMNILFADYHTEWANASVVRNWAAGGASEPHFYNN